VDWSGLWAKTDEEWQTMVADLRALPEGERMRVDDTTLIMLRLLPASAPVTSAFSTEVSLPGPLTIGESSTFEEESDFQAFEESPR
jgi:hypothetical protein